MAVLVRNGKVRTARGKVRTGSAGDSCCCGARCPCEGFTNPSAVAIDGYSYTFFAVCPASIGTCAEADAWNGVFINAITDPNEHVCAYLNNTGAGNHCVNTKVLKGDAGNARYSLFYNCPSPNNPYDPFGGPPVPFNTLYQNRWVIELVLECALCAEVLLWSGYGPTNPSSPIGTYTRIDGCDLTPTLDIV